MFGSPLWELALLESDTGKSNLSAQGHFPESFCSFSGTCNFTAGTQAFQFLFLDRTSWTLWESTCSWGTFRWSRNYEATGFFTEGYCDTATSCCFCSDCRQTLFVASINIRTRDRNFSCCYSSTVTDCSVFNIPFFVSAHTCNLTSHSHNTNL